MALILHLSDLHLGQTRVEDIFDDYKSEIVPVEERIRRQSLLSATIRKVGTYLEQNNLQLDAIAVTGDITVANRDEGFGQLPDLLANLGRSAPLANRIVVIPGNHDVTWQTPASSAERYSNFLTTVRSRGYVTPLLDGIDFDVDATRANITDHLLALDEGRLAILPINSCNYSGMLEPLKEINDSEYLEATDALPIDLRTRFQKELKRLRLHDVARISWRQLEVMAEALKAKRSEGLLRPDSVNVDLIHHQLLPVSTREEFKSYESIVNLGLVRKFLRDNDIKVILHGHKHAGYVYWDHIYDYNEQTNASSLPHTVLVISGSTIGGIDYSKTDVCRLIHFDVQTTAPQVAISSVPVVEHGTNLPPLGQRIFPLWGQTDPTPHGIRPAVIVGKGLNEVYDRIVALFAQFEHNESLHNLFCHIEVNESQPSLPEQYPTIPGKTGGEREVWFNQLVRWWQRRRTALSERVNFTHGERIYEYGPDGVDQLKNAVEALGTKSETSRAVISLIDPTWDYANDPRRKFPHFCLVQLKLAKSQSGDLLLNCIGYFRKQEMRYWWPVNIAELSYIQRDALRRLQASHRNLRLGSISTVAALAYASQSCPKVAVPLIDRIFDEDKNQLWSLAHFLFLPDLTHQSLAQLWLDVIEDLVPQEIPDPDGVPVAIEGLNALCEQIARFKEFHQSRLFESIYGELISLYTENRSYAEKTKVSSYDPDEHTRWRNMCIVRVQKIKNFLAQVPGFPLRGH